MRCVDRVVLQELLSEGLSLSEIGRRFDRHEATVAHWIHRHGLEAVGRKQHAAKGALTRSQLQPLIEAGMSIAQIAEAVGRSKATSRHRLRRYGLTTAGASGRRRTIESERAKRDGLVEADMRCSRHGETRFVLDQRG
jgi:transposase